MRNFLLLMDLELSPALDPPLEISRDWWDPELQFGLMSHLLPEFRDCRESQRFYMISLLSTCTSLLVLKPCQQKLLLCCCFRASQYWILKFTEPIPTCRVEYPNVNLPG